jgi:tetratricopeptide (TPR) repeat protein
MRDGTNSLIARAEQCMNDRKFNDAGKCFEEAAASVGDKREGVEFLKKAAQAYDESGVTEDALRCYLEASQFLDKTEKAECLLACFRVYVSKIAGYEYDCGFEWRGATDGSHDDDHNFYQGKIKQYQSEAEKVLREALRIEGADKNKIIRQAKDECTKMKRGGGWGESACWYIVTSATKGSVD